jgi:hypothetical protein
MFIRNCLAYSLLAGQCGFTCECGHVRRFCQAPLDPSDKRTAVFVGTVRDVYPSETYEDYRQVLLPERSTKGGAPVTVEELRKRILQMWAGELTPGEEETIKAAASWRELLAPSNSTRWAMRRRVIFTVLEPFSNAPEGTFKLFTGFGGGGDCGVAFKTGKTLLVVADLDSTGRWVTSICSGSRVVQSDEAVLRALRAWKIGRPFNLLCPE